MQKCRHCIPVKSVLPLVFFEKKKEKKKRRRMGYSIATCVFWKKKYIKKKGAIWVSQCVLPLEFFEFFFKILKIKRKIKKNVVLSLFDSLMKSRLLLRKIFFFSC